MTKRQVLQDVHVTDAFIVYLIQNISSCHCTRIISTGDVSGVPCNESIVYCFHWHISMLAIVYLITYKEGSKQHYQV